MNRPILRGPTCPARPSATPWLLGLAVLLATLVACSTPEPRGVKIGQRVPDFEIAGLDGDPVESLSLEGQPIVVNFWATWCQPCKKEIPVLQELHDSQRVRVLGIALDEDREQTVAPFVEEWQISYPVAFGDQDLFRRYGGFGIPYTLVLDASWQLVDIYRGPVTLGDIEEDLALIAAAEKQAAVGSSTPSEAESDA